MRPKLAGSTRLTNPFAPFAPNNIFERNMTSAARRASQELAKRYANQLNYSSASYSYNVEPAPNFYGAAYAGGKIGYMTASGSTESHLQFVTYTPTILVVPPTTLRHKVTFVNSKGEPEPAGAASNLQAFWEAVPVPSVSTIPEGSLTYATGTDHHLCIICGHEMWEFWKFEANEPPYTAQYGGYVADMRTFLGVLPNKWGARATGLALIGGLITMQDIVEVLRGGKINHAIGISAPVSGPGWVSPATRSDAGEGSYFGGAPELHEGTPNPAYPYTDAVPEGSWFVFPAASRPSEYGINATKEPIAAAIFEAIRTYGCFIHDSGAGSLTIQLESPVALGSPYSWVKVDPTAAGPFNWSFYDKAWIPASWGDPTLHKITEEIQGTEGILTKQPWKTLEVLEPFTP